MLNRIILKFRKLLYSPYKWAKYLGVIIGENNLMGKNHWSSEPYLITIGSNCQLTDCQIHTHGGGNSIRHKYPNYDSFGKVVIGDWVYIGTKAQVMPGVTIGDHVIVAAGSIVTKSIPAGCIVAGNPARIIGTIDDYIYKNLKWNVATKQLSYKDKKRVLQSLPNERFIKREYMQFPEGL